jgi:cytochrome b561
MEPLETVKSHYPLPGRFLHWLMALALAANFMLGTSISAMQLSPQKLQLLAWHKWAGITLLGLVSLRLLNRLAFPPPAPEPGPAWQRRAAALVHTALYVLMFAIPFSGWLVSSAAGISVVYLGVWELPQLLPKNIEWVDTLKGVHEALNQTLLTLVVLHVAAAMKHHFIDHDRSLIRMLPSLEKTKPEKPQ